MLRFECILSERLINSLWKSDILLFFEFINRVSILYCICIEFTVLLYNLAVILFSRNKEYII